MGSAVVNTHQNFPAKIHPLLFAVWFGFVFVVCDAPRVLAQELDIPDTPLTIGGNVKPNVFLLMDDSGSMRAEVLRRPGTYPFYDIIFFPGDGAADVTPDRDDRDEILEVCLGYNALFFNPEVTYTPWEGVDGAGVPFANQSITSARSNPFNSSPAFDLTQPDSRGNQAGFMPWNDADGDGDFDLGECADPIDEDYDFDSLFIEISSLSSEQQQNFANWYTYYRSRDYVMKRAITPVVANFDMRMGLATLNNNNNVGTPIADLTLDDNREVLLRNVTRIRTGNTTPLRQRLQDVGEYYDQTDNADHSALGFTDSNPLLPAGEGGQCQQNFTLLLSDGFWNGVSPGVGDTDGDGNTDFDGGSYADEYSDTLADVAMHFYERDLHSNYEDLVPTSVSSNDLNTAQHMVTYTISFGLQGTLPAGPTNFEAPFPWPEVIGGGATTVDDMLHAAWNGRGEFLPASDPDQLIAAFNGILNDIEARSGSSSSAAANGGSISTANRIFQAQFDSADWSGRLFSFGVSDSGALNSIPSWEAGALLNDQPDSYFAATRGIYTLNPDNSTGISFFWDNLTANQQELLSIDPDTGVMDGLGEERANFIRGVEDMNQPFRRRINKLGDFVDSDPFFISAPGFFYPFNNYQQFFLNNQNRTPTIYIGGNDGMLHAFNANTGEELFNYIPNAVIENLNQLSNPDYNHRFYVNGPPNTGDVFFGGGWHSIVTGGLRNGGQAVYALDVTDPDNFSAADVLFEFTDKNDADLGLTFAKPKIARMNNGKWAIIFGNGYNSTRPDGNVSADGNAALFILFIEDGLDGFSVGEFIKLETSAGTFTDANGETYANGLGTVGVADVDGDSNIDWIYAGDLQGNLWKFDVTSGDPSAWDIAFGGLPLHAAVGPDGNGQPILAAPTAIAHPLGIAQGALILFGTGRYLIDADKDPDLSGQQTFYAVWDRDAALNRNEGFRGFSRSQFAEIQLSNLGEFRVVNESTSDVPEWMNADGDPVDRGWYVDLPAQGERVIREVIVRSGIVFFVTLIPSQEPCIAGGTGFLMALDTNTGGVPIPDGENEMVIFDINQDGDFDLDDNISDQVVVGLQENGIPNLPAVIFDPRPLCERDPGNDACVDENGNSTASNVGSFPPPLNAFRGCGSEAQRVYLFTTTSNGDVRPSTAQLQGINCGRQAWRQLR